MGASCCNARRTSASVPRRNFIKQTRDGASDETRYDGTLLSRRVARGPSPSSETETRGGRGDKSGGRERLGRMLGKELKVCARQALLGRGGEGRGVELNFQLVNGRQVLLFAHRANIYNIR